MLEIWNENYFIDLDEIEKYLELEEPNELNATGDTETKINLIKFELVKLLLDVVLSEQMDMDEGLGLKKNTNTMSIPFKLAFNSLLNKKLINHY
jgi:hypothetical protein